MVLLDRYGYVFRSLDAFDESIQCYSGFEHLALDRIAPYDQATGAVGLVIAAMDEDADKMRHIVQIRELAFEPWAVLHRNLVGSGGDSSLGIFLRRTLASDSLGGIWAGRWKVADNILDGIAEVFPVDIEPADGVGRPFKNAF